MKHVRFLLYFEPITVITAYNLLNYNLIAYRCSINNQWFKQGCHTF